jgi:ribose 5-phosphate isomerase
LDVIGTFIVGTTCRELVHELGRKSHTKASELLDITTNFATGEEAVGAIFPNGKRKRKEDAAEDSASCDPKKKMKKGRQGKQQR